MSVAVGWMYDSICWWNSS